MACFMGLIVVVVVGVVFGGASSAAKFNTDYEKDPTYWHNVAQEEMDTFLTEQPYGVAKNVILFLGDGMGPTTVTAARILAGQKIGKTGEDHKLSFDTFPYTGFSRTYNTDHQVTDSAASGTAYLTGVKTDDGVLGLSGAVTFGNCSSAQGHSVDSILRWSVQAGKSTGVVTTTRITHATPAAAYSHTPNRDWESDRQIPVSERACQDIALQLIDNNGDINVIMGGGRAYFYPENFTDPDPDPSFNPNSVSRLDSRNLVQEWKNDKAQKNLKHAFVFDKAGFDTVNPVETDYLLALFRQDHMSYELDRDPAKEPSLAEMTQKAISILKKNENGFFLLVEGGRIDHGHHASQPAYALNEVVSLAEAVDMATKVTDKSDTLIVVTADHSHVINIAGYASRGNPILGVSDNNNQISLEDVIDKKAYATLLYGNGPGYVLPRPNITAADLENKTYVSQSAVPMSSETHGGEDVAIYALGPHSFLYTGVHEQNYIPMVMAYASCVGPYATGAGKPCARDRKIDITFSMMTDEVRPNSIEIVQPSMLVLYLSYLLYCFIK